VPALVCDDWWWLAAVHDEEAGALMADIYTRTAGAVAVDEVAF
jgi:hypothetical protein